MASRRGYGPLDGPSQSDAPHGSTGTSDGSAGHGGRGRPERSESVRRSAALLDVVWIKVQAAVWVVLGAVTFVYGGVWNAALRDDRVYSFFLFLALCAAAFVAAIYTYLVLYLRLWARVTVAWEVYCPHLIHYASAGAVTSGLCFMLAFWPVYGFLTPLMLACIAMGCLMVFHFIPAP